MKSKRTTVRLGLRAEAPSKHNHTFPILAVKDTIIFPAMVLPITITDEKTIRMIDGIMDNDRKFAYFSVKESSGEFVHPYDLYEYGTLSEILRRIVLPEGGIRILAQGLDRVKLKRVVQRVPIITAEVERLGEREEDTPRTRALVRNVAAQFLQLAKLVPYMPEEIQTIVINLTDPVKLSYFVAFNVNISMPEKQRVLEIDSPTKRLERLDALLHRELQILHLGKKIESEVQGEFEKIQKDHFLREQLKVIQKELGEEDERTQEVVELKKRMERAGLSAEGYAAAEQEIHRMARIAPGSPEYTVVRTYLEWLISLPWSQITSDRLDVRHAKKILEADHYGLKDVKERILEYLAVRKLKNSIKGPILCFIGPPGVGKTSLGMSIARSMGRKFVRMSLGGIRDEAEIRGHRRTYIGALPGRIVQSLRRTESRNPVFMLDEIDKLGMDFRGDPASALLEVLDPEQNHAFQDHYLDVPFDLSQVLFIATANITDPIPAALMDRMEMIEIPGYTEEEKLVIARRHLIPKQIENHGLAKTQIRFDDRAIRTLISSYTREAGLRNIEREIARLCRKTARELTAGRKKTVRITTDVLARYLGPERYYQDVAERTTDIGVATGLAWTRLGGDILFVEATRMPGSRNMMLTGQLGDVMKESAHAALSYLRSRARAYGIDESFFEKHDLHIHIPSGAIPKDGPSAGITLAAALYSLLKGIRLKPSLAMTGEITLRGRVLPVGGIKEKVLAARRAGIKTVILPAWNRNDLSELPPEARRHLHFVFIKTIDEMIQRAFPR